MTEPPIYGIALTLEIQAAIRAIRRRNQPATNRSIRDHIAKKYEITLVGNPKLNFTRRITEATGKLTELGYCNRIIKQNKTLNTFYYEYEIGSQADPAEDSQ